jgi:hypothetical protein
MCTPSATSAPGSQRFGLALGALPYRSRAPAARRASRRRLRAGAAGRRATVRRVPVPGQERLWTNSVRRTSRADIPGALERAARCQATSSRRRPAPLPRNPRRLQSQRPGRVPGRHHSPRISAVAPHVAPSLLSATTAMSPRRVARQRRVANARVEHVVGEMQARGPAQALMSSPRRPARQPQVSPNSRARTARSTIRGDGRVDGGVAPAGNPRLRRSSE